MLLSDVCLSVAYIGRNLRTERPRKTKIGIEVAHVTRDSDTTFKVKGQGHQAALVGCTGRPTWTYSNGGLSTCVHDVYRVTTCRPGRGHIVAAARLQLVNIRPNSEFKCNMNSSVQLRSTSYYIMSAKIALKPISDTAYVET